MELFKTIFTGTFTLTQFLLAIAASLVLGLLTSLYYMYRSQHTSSMALSLVLIPAVEAVVIMMINDNLGAGIAVAGSFALIRFRSVKGSAKELTCVFLAMAIGIICGTGYIALAAVFTVLLLGVAYVLTMAGFGKDSMNKRYLKITVPESLNYDEAFEDILDSYTSGHELISVKTMDLGSLYRVEYDVDLKHPEKVKEMIDELRTRNGNLEIMCGAAAGGKEEL